MMTRPILAAVVTILLATFACGAPNPVAPAKPPQKKVTNKLPKTITTCQTYAARSVFEEHPGGAERSTVLWFRYPALNWIEALPIGNGSFGGMDFGGLTKDVIQFNHDTLWTPPDLSDKILNNPYPDKRKEINEVRRLIFSGKAYEAHQIVNESIQEKYDVGSYQPFGELQFEYDFGGELEKGAIKNYQRELDMETGVSSTHFEIDNTKFERQVFVTNDKDVIGIRMK